MLKFEIRDRFVYFRIKEIRNGRIIYQFDSSTRVSFDERDVVLCSEELNPVDVGRQRVQLRWPHRPEACVPDRHCLAITRRGRRFSTGLFPAEKQGRTRQRPRSAARRR